MNSRPAPQTHQGSMCCDARQDRTLSTHARTLTLLSIVAGVWFGSYVLDSNPRNRHGRWVWAAVAGLVVAWVARVSVPWLIESALGFQHLILGHRGAFFRGALPGVAIGAVLGNFLWDAFFSFWAGLRLMSIFAALGGLAAGCARAH